MKVIQKPGEEVNFYMLDDDRQKRIQKYEQEIDNVRTQLYSMTQKYKSLETIKIENEQLRVQISMTGANRNELERQLIDSSYSYQIQIKSNHDKIDKLTKDKKHSDEWINKFTEDNHKLQSDNMKPVIRLKAKNGTTFDSCRMTKL